MKIMRNAIWKYPLEQIADTIGIDMPKGAEILTLQMQNSEPCIWAFVNPEAKKEKRFFRIIGTGHLIEPEERKYIGTFQLMSGALVFHLYELL